MFVHCAELDNIQSRQLCTLTECRMSHYSLLTPARTPLTISPIVACRLKMSIVQEVRFACPNALYIMPVLTLFLQLIYVWVDRSVYCTA